MTSTVFKLFKVIFVFLDESNPILTLSHFQAFLPLLAQGWRKAKSIGVAGPSKSPKYWCGRLWQIVANVTNIGMYGSCHTLPPDSPTPVASLYLTNFDHLIQQDYFKNKDFFR